MKEQSITRKKIMVKFHPISLDVSSHETQADFKKFFKSIDSLCAEMDIEIEIDYAMQDACPAFLNAFSEIFEDVSVLMLTSLKMEQKQSQAVL